MGQWGAPSRALALAGVAILGLAGSVGAGCELGVGDSIPPFECLGDGSDTCPADEVCSPTSKTCVARSTTCSCPDGFACDPMTLACVATDTGAGPLDGGTTPPDDDGSDASGAGDAAAFDAAMLSDGSVDADATDGAGASSGDADEETSSPDATLGTPVDATTDSTTDAMTASDASTQPGDGSGAEAESDSGTCHGLLCSCSASAQCTSGLCAQESAVTQDLYEQADGTDFCTQACCSSSDCGPSTVCFGTGAGGNYCVDPAWLSRSSSLGTLAGGATCGTNADCRSGLCTGGACVDTCCSTAQASTACASGATCNLGTFPGAGAFDTHRTGFCNASTVACGLSPCTACRTSSDCSVIDQVCSYAAAALGSSDIVATCEPPAPGPGGQGAACTSGSACASGYCDSTSQQCSDVCFTNADCKTGWRCRTELDTGGGNYYVLRCGS
jgi:hypothetical protein